MCKGRRRRGGFLASRAPAPAAWLAIGALLAILYLGFLGARSLWVPDEGRYAEIAREMLVSGDLVTPRLDGAKYFEKPPLWYWITAGSLALLGPSEWAARLPLALAGLATLALVAWLGARMASPRVGLLAALILGSAPLHYGCAQFLVLDGGLSLLVTLALVATIGAEQALGPPYLWELSAAALALGTLEKGPVAVVLWAMVAGPYLALGGGWRAVSRARFARCAALYLLTAVPWFVLVQHRNPEFAHFFFIHEHLERYLQDTHFRAGPPYYFIAVVLAGLFPWSMTVPALAVSATGPGEPRKARAVALLWLLVPLLIARLASPPDSVAATRAIGALSGLWILLPGAAALLADRHRTLALVAALWAMAPLAFFSVSQSKLPPYVLPAWPGLALMCALAWDRLLDGVEREGARTLSLMLASSAILLIAAGAAVPRLFKPVDYPDLVAIEPRLVALLVLGGATLAVTAAMSWKHSLRPALLALAAVAFLALAGGQVLAHIYEPEKDVRVMARAIQSVRRPGERVIIYGPLESASSLPYYLGEPVPISGFIWGELSFAHDLDEPAARFLFIEFKSVFVLMQPASPKAYFLTNPATFHELSIIPQFRLIELGRRGDLVLFTNRA